MSRLCAAAALAFVLAAPCGASAETGRADVALVLAIDVSGSIDDYRFKLQREGIAAALESEDVAAAISGGVNQTVELAVVEWAEEQHVLVPWTVLRGRDDLEALATAPARRKPILGAYEDRSRRRHRRRAAPVRRPAAARRAPGDRRVGRRPAKHRRDTDRRCARHGGLAGTHDQRAPDRLR